MKKLIYEKNIVGFPVSKFKIKGNKNKTEEWKTAVIRQTQDGVGLLKSECKMKVVFKFHSSQYPTDFPYGPDLDNCIKNLWDALNETLFLKVTGCDSCVKQLDVSKYKYDDSGKCGTIIKIFV